MKKRMAGGGGVRRERLEEVGCVMCVVGGAPS